MRVILFFSLFLMLNQANAQDQPIINGIETFGNWDTCAAGEIPQYWDGFNRQVIINGMNLGEVICVKKDSADPKDINYSVRITSEAVLGGSVVAGMLTTGNLNINFTNQDGTIDGGIPYTQKPAMLKGWYKYTPNGTDTAQISVWFKKNGENFGGGKLNLNSQKQVWTLFEIPLNYQPNITPDTVNILFSSSIMKNNLPIGSCLEIDHIWFEGGSLGVNNKQDLINITKIYPNPTSSYVYIEVPKNMKNYTVSIYNTSGQRIITISSKSKVSKVSTNKLSKGVYFVEVCSNKLRKISKLLIR